MISEQLRHMNAYKTISELCCEFGIEAFGVTTALPFKSLAELLSVTMDFCEKDVNKRICPTLTMESAKSIICFLFPYKTRPEGECESKIPKIKKGEIVSGDVWLGEDYHVYIINKLKQLCHRMELKFGGEYMSFCDTGPLADKEIAVRAGLCEYGRNSLAISGQFGSFFYIGYVLTDLEIENAKMCETRKLFKLCKSCNKCVKACPTGALSIDKPFEHTKCVSYISQKKGDLTDEEARALGSSIYGCHICQNVCPANNKAEFVAYVDLESRTGISNREFARKYGNTAMRFLGKKMFERNVRAVLNNSK